MAGNAFVKGRTNNHLVWTMVDATDFATPESALSAATKIKIYGKLRSATGTNFVSSGTGSLTNDIVHVGASALGIYTIALAKADLSDASAAWYDTYVISLSATGAAYQTLIVDGGIDISALLALSDAVSNVMSAVTVVQSMASDAASAAAQANSRVLLVQSRLSDFDSRLVSDVSDIRSMLTALSDAISDAHSDLGSKIGAITATVSASDISDIASAVRAILVSDLSDILSAAVQTNSRVLVVQSLVSDVDSALTSRFSNLESLLTTTGVALNASALSDLRSAIAAGPAATITASDISDIASAVWANTIGARVDSRIVLVQSRLSDLDSRLVSDVSDIRSMLTALSDAISDAHSDLGSKIGAVTATVTASDMSDIASRVDVLLASRLSDILSAAQQANSRVLVAQSMISDTYSQLSNALSGPMTASDLSDIASAVWAHTIGARVDSRVLVVQSQASDIYSQLSDFRSDLGSLVTTTGVQLNASTMSDLRSAITAITATVSESDMSDIASRVGVLLASDLSDILSGVRATQSMASDAASAAQQANSRVLVAHSMISDVDSALTSRFSNLESLLTTTGVQLNASTMSDLRSAVGNISVTLTASDISDIASAVAAAVTTINASDISDIASAVRAILVSDLSDILSGVRATQSMASDAASAAQQGSSRALLLMSSLSDVQSAVTVVQSMASDAASAAQQASSRILVAQSMVSDVDSALTSRFSNLESLLTTTGVALNASAMSDLRSAIEAGGGASTLSDILSAAQQTNSRVELVRSQASDIYSLLSDLHSDVGVISGVVSDIDSLVEAGVEIGASSLSDLRSAITAAGVNRAGADITGVVGVTGTVAEKIDFLTALARNQVTQTATLQKVTNDAGSVIASAAVSDDGTTFTRGEWAG